MNTLYYRCAVNQENLVAMVNALASTHVDTIIQCVHAKFQQYHPASSSSNATGAPAAALQGEAMLFQVCQCYGGIAYVCVYAWRNVWRHCIRMRYIYSICMDKCMETLFMRYILYVYGEIYGDIVY